MRLNSFGFVCLLLVVTFVYAEDLNDENEESFSTTTTRRTTRKRSRKTTTQTPIEETTVNYPICRVETIENLPGYICERQIDGQTKQFVFRIDKNNLIQCGDFVDGKINGNGYTFVFEESKPSSHQCGDHVDGFLHGFASFHSYEQKDLQIGHFLNGERDGRTLYYDFTTDFISTSRYENGNCKSAIWYNLQGDVLRDRSFSCSYY